MFKLGFALVLIVVACNCSTSPLDEEPERAMEESLAEFSDDLEETFDDAADDGFDEREAEYFEEENDPIEGRKLVFLRKIRYLLRFHHLFLDAFYSALYCLHCMFSRLESFLFVGSFL